MNEEIQASMTRSKHQRTYTRDVQAPPATLYSATLAGLVVDGHHLLRGTGNKNGMRNVDVI